MSRGPSEIVAEHLVEICERTDMQTADIHTDIQTRRWQYLALLRRRSDEVYKRLMNVPFSHSELPINVFERNKLYSKVLKVFN